MGEKHQEEEEEEELRGKHDQHDRLDLSRLLGRSPSSGTTMIAGTVPENIVVRPAESG